MNHTIEELIELAKQAKKPIKKKKPDDKEKEIISFIGHFQLKEGPKKVASRDLYYLYTKWCKNPMTYVAFSKRFTKYYQSIFEKRKSYYFLSSSYDQLRLKDKHEEKESG